MTIHLVSRQVGTAYPFVEFHHLLKKSGFSVKNYAYPSGAAPYQEAGIPFEVVNSFEDYIKLTTEVPSVLMTGTSLEAEDDYRYWSHAKTNRITSVGWLDQPNSVAERFTAGRPDVILSNDKNTMSQLRETGIVENTFSHGSPYLHALSKRIQRKVHPKTFFFATEPYFVDRTDYLSREETHYRLQYGFDDVDALLYATVLTEKFRRQTGEAWKILVKPHAVDNVSRFKEAFLKAGGNPAHLEFTTLDKESVLAAAPVVIGMRSMFLFEAASLGIPTISLQPGQKIAWPFMDSHSGILSLNGGETDFGRFTQLLTNLSDRPMQTDFEENAVIQLFSNLGAKK
ncbi:MAG: hypothetical protein V4692_14995 [Bdellovibrionota bacterium]